MKKAEDIIAAIESMPNDERLLTLILLNDHYFYREPDELMRIAEKHKKRIEEKLRKEAVQAADEAGYTVNNALYREAFIEGYMRGDNDGENA